MSSSMRRSSFSSLLSTAVLRVLRRSSTRNRGSWGTVNFLEVQFKMGRAGLALDVSLAEAGTRLARLHVIRGGEGMEVLSPRCVKFWGDGLGEMADSLVLGRVSGLVQFSVIVAQIGGSLAETHGLIEVCIGMNRFWI